MFIRIIIILSLFGIFNSCAKNKDIVYVARDPYGVRPLFIGFTLDDELFICSELKGIHDKCVYVKQFNPGTYLEEHLLEQYFTRSQFNLHFFLQTKVLLQTRQILEGKFCFFI